MAACQSCRNRWCLRTYDSSTTSGSRTTPSPTPRFSAAGMPRAVRPRTLGRSRPMGRLGDDGDVFTARVAFAEAALGQIGVGRAALSPRRVHCGVSWRRSPTSTATRRSCASHSTPSGAAPQRDATYRLGTMAGRARSADGRLRVYHLGTERPCRRGGVRRRRRLHRRRRLRGGSRRRAGAVERPGMVCGRASWRDHPAQLGRRYMYRITRDDGAPACERHVLLQQVGSGAVTRAEALRRHAGGAGRHAELLGRRRRGVRT